MAVTTKEAQRAELQMTTERKMKKECNFAEVVLASVGCFFMATLGQSARSFVIRQDVAVA